MPKKKNQGVSSINLFFLDRAKKHLKLLTKKFENVNNSESPSTFGQENLFVHLGQTY